MVVTETWASLPTSQGRCVLQVTYDDVDGKLTEFHLSTPVEAVVTLRRGNGAAWWDVRAAGEHVQRAGGPVRNLSDIVEMTVGVVYGGG